jgi:excisionase family DNA binding protein
MTDDNELPLNQKPVLTLEEACRISTFGMTTLYRAIRAKQLVARKMGKRTIVLRSDLDTWIATFEEKPAPRAPSPAGGR